MKRIFLSTLLALLAIGPASADPALKVPMDRRGIHGDRLCCHGRDPSWSGAYADPTFGAPVALVVPPTAELQTHYGWGVGNTRITPNCPQFNRIYPGRWGLQLEGLHGHSSLAQHDRPIRGVLRSRAVALNGPTERFI